MFIGPEFMTPLLAACLFSSAEVVDLLLSCPTIDANLRDEEGSTILHGYSFNHPHLLIDSGKFALEARNRAGQTPLALAACKGDLGLLKALLRTRKAEIEPLNSDGRTPLMLAIQSRKPNPAVVKILLETGQVDAWRQSTTSGKSAFVIALDVKKQSDKHCQICDMVEAYGRKQLAQERSG
jgi:ankyrin repeat protein